MINLCSMAVVTMMMIHVRDLQVYMKHLYHLAMTHMFLAMIKVCHSHFLLLLWETTLSHSLKRYYQRIFFQDTYVCTYIHIICMYVINILDHVHSHDTVVSEIFAGCNFRQSLDLGLFAILFFRMANLF